MKTKENILNKINEFEDTISFWQIEWIKDNVSQKEYYYWKEYYQAQILILKWVLDNQTQINLNIDSTIYNLEKTINFYSNTLYKNSDKIINLEYKKAHKFTQNKNSENEIELNIKSKIFPNYTYRIMFIKFKNNCYPIEIDLEEGIVEELSLKKLNIQCSNEDEFNDLINKVFESKMIKTIFNNLKKKG